MRLIHNVKGISKLALILLLLIAFIIGALLSYVWTMSYYAPSEYFLPSKANITIENVEFSAQNATFFNATVLNPSYSPSPVKIEQFLMVTPGGMLLKTANATPNLPYELAPGSFQTFMVYLNWGNYTGQNVSVAAVVEEGTGSTLVKATPPMNLTIVKLEFNPGISVTHFNVTLQSTGSPASVDIIKMFLNGEDVSTLVSPALAPYTLDPNATVTFTVNQNWINLQGANVTVSVQTLQGYTAFKTLQTLPPVLLSFIDVSFDVNDTGHFNFTLLNQGVSPTSVNIKEVLVSVAGNVPVPVQNWTASRPSLEPNLPTQVVCDWDWSTYRGQVVTIIVPTVQGFQVTSPQETLP